MTKGAIDRLLRNMDPYKTAVKATKHVALSAEVQRAFDKWFRLDNEGVLIGGLAMSFYATPRYTQDVNVLFLHKIYIPQEVPGFKPTRPGAYQDNDTHVEIEVLTKESFNNEVDAVLTKVFSTARTIDGVRVASQEGMIALKLISSFVPRRRLRDSADIQSLLQYHDTDMEDWPLTEAQRARLQEIKSELL